MSSDLFSLAQALCALALLGALVWLVRRTGFGVLVPRTNRLLEIEERLPLDLRNGLVIVRAEDRRLLLAVSDHSPARLLLELPANLRARSEEPRASTSQEAAPGA